MGNANQTMQDIFIDPNIRGFPTDFIPVGQVSNGRLGRGTVYEHNSQNFGIFEKIIPAGSQEILQAWTGALKRHRMLNSQFTVKLLGFRVNQDDSFCAAGGSHINAYYEYMDESLQQRLENQIHNQTFPKESSVINILFRISKLMSFLYSKHHYENNISLDTIFLNQSGEIKVIPNLCLPQDQDLKMRVVQGQLDYIDPSLVIQCLQQNLPSRIKMKIDSYALGLVLLQMCSLTKINFAAKLNPQIQAMQQVMKDNYTKGVNGFVNLLVSPSEDRPTFIEVQTQLAPYEYEILQEDSPTQFFQKQSLASQNKDGQYPPFEDDQSIHSNQTPQTPQMQNSLQPQQSLEQITQGENPTSIQPQFQNQTQLQHQNRNFNLQSPHNPALKSFQSPVQSHKQTSRHPHGKTLRQSISPKVQNPPQQQILRKSSQNQIQTLNLDASPYSTFNNQKTINPLLSTPPLLRTPIKSSDFSFNRPNTIAALRNESPISYRMLSPSSVISNSTFNSPRLSSNLQQLVKTPIQSPQLQLHASKQYLQQSSTLQPNLGQLPLIPSTQLQQFPPQKNFPGAGGFIQTNQQINNPSLQREGLIQQGLNQAQQLGIQQLASQRGEQMSQRFDQQQGGVVSSQQNQQLNQQGSLNQGLVTQQMGGVQQSQQIQGQQQQTQQFNQTNQTNQTNQINQTNQQITSQGGLNIQSSQQLQGYQQQIQQAGLNQRGDLQQVGAILQQQQIQGQAFQTNQLNSLQGGSIQPSQQEYQQSNQQTNINQLQLLQPQVQRNYQPPDSYQGQNQNTQLNTQYITSNQNFQQLGTNIQQQQTQEQQLSPQLLGPQVGYNQTNQINLQQGQLSTLPPQQLQDYHQYSGSSQGVTNLQSQQIQSQQSVQQMGPTDGLNQTNQLSIQQQGGPIQYPQQLQYQPYQSPIQRGDLQPIGTNMTPQQQGQQPSAQQQGPYQPNNQTVQVTTQQVGTSQPTQQTQQYQQQIYQSNSYSPQTNLPNPQQMEPSIDQGNDQNPQQAGVYPGDYSQQQYPPKQAQQNISDNPFQYKRAQDVSEGLQWRYQRAMDKAMQVLNR